MTENSIGGRWSVDGLKVAAFGAFSGFDVNPSLLLARDVFDVVEELEVSFRSVDEWLDNLAGQAWTALLILGVSASAQKLRLETVGRNVIGPSPDVCGEVRGPGPIGVGPATIKARLWPASALDATGMDWTVGDDAGQYLCNYVLYRALDLYPDRRIGFLHVPPFTTMSLEEQSRALRNLCPMIALSLEVEAPRTTH